jgi:hypothetical protein
MPPRPEQDRRREQRHPAGGEVRIWMNADTAPIRCRLLDISRRGFRVLHQQADLYAGSEVRFEHAQASGRARVVWNHVLAGKVESGLLIV